jgi:hypothetical protein
LTGPAPAVTLPSIRTSVEPTGLESRNRSFRRLLLGASLLCLAAGRQATHAAEGRTIGRVGAGVQLGGFYDLRDPGLELRGWAKGLGLSISLGRHTAEPSQPGFTQVFSKAGQQATGGLLLAVINAETAKLYATAGLVHATQARGSWERATPAPDGTTGEAAVEGATGTWPFAGIGAEIGLRAVPGLALGGELLLASGGDGGAAPGIRFAVRYYVW